MEIIQKPTPHQSNTRKGHSPIAIVIHISTASLESCDNWFANPESKVSAHYCVGKAGQVHQYVDEWSVAYHAGTIFKPVAKVVLDKKLVSPNLYTIGIEHEGKATDQWPDAQYEASAKLIAEICQRWNIPCDADHIIPHRHIRANKECPGYAVNLTKLVALAASYSSPGEQEQ